jgi:glucose-1-phosphate thymidylyltransferase
MKALILSGGKGSRLRPITHTSAKQLIPIANKPILFYGLEAIRNAGIKDVGVITGETANDIKESLGNGSAWGLNITYIQQESPLGLAHAVKIAQGYLKKEPFVMFLGDNLIKDGITPFVEEFKKDKPNALVLLAKVKNPQDFGVAQLKGEKVINLKEKPKKPKTNLALVGVYLFDHTIFEAIRHIRPSWRNELEITDAISYLIHHDSRVQSHVIDGWWKDTGKLEDLLEANRIMLDTLQLRVAGKVSNDSNLYGKVVIEKGASVVHSIIRGPAIIGVNTRIVNSYIGPFTSVYHDVKVENSEIEHSIILEESKIENIVRIEDSLIGKNVAVFRHPKKPQAYRFMLGDSSRVGII